LRPVFRTRPEEEAMKNTNSGQAEHQTIFPTLTHVEQLEEACHRVILQSGDEQARSGLKALLHLDLHEGLSPLSPAASLAKLAASHASSLAVLLEDDRSNGLALRVATARLCQTLTSLRGHLSGRRMIGGPRTLN
jgi:hypothetical protein